LSIYRRTVSKHATACGISEQEQADALASKSTHHEALFEVALRHCGNVPS